MTLHMSKIVQSVAESLGWSAVSRIGVPLILALLLTGVPTHLLWAAWVNEQITVAKHEALVVAATVKELKDTARENAYRDGSLREDMASMKSNVTAILRAIDRVEKQVDGINRPDRR